MRPEILSHDLKAGLGMVSIVPGIGSPYRPTSIAGVRRFYLSRLMSHLYYTHDEREWSFGLCGIPEEARVQISARKERLQGGPGVSSPASI